MARRSDRRKKLVFKVGVPLLLALSALFVLFAVQRSPEPSELYLSARQYLNLAREARADLDAPETFAAATTKLRLARSEMMSQFGRPAFLREYGETRRMLMDAHRTIALSIEEARRESADRGARLQDEALAIRKEAGEVRSLLLHLPPRYHRALRHIVSAESRLRATEAKLTAMESRDALESLQIARGEVSLALRNVRGLLLSFLERRSEWNEDLRHTLDWSRSTGGTAILVDKLNHTVHVVQGGRSVREYPVEFGPGWLDQKIRAGDQATPEGRYRVVSKKNGSRYYRALLLNYPNDEDIRRFRRLTANGYLSRGARPGGLIEIHGGGGKGEDWTLGCISLRNEHVDQLFRRVSVGTPVTIVGLWNEPPWLARALQTASR